MKKKDHKGTPTGIVTILIPYIFIPVITAT